MYQSQSYQQNAKRQFLIFQSENYVENKSIYDDVGCQKCYQVFPKMRQCGSCSKVYCPNCIDTKTIGINKCCPNCNSNQEVLLPNQRLMTLSQIVFKCQFNIQGCKTCLNMENLLAHEETCSFQNKQSQIQQLSYSSPVSKSILAYSTASSSPGKKLLQGYGGQSEIFQSIYRVSETESDFVTLAEFKKLMNEVCILKQLCAANFKNNCNNGHPLKYESKDANITNNVICDVCKREPTSQSVGSYRCATCDFDRCEQCYLQNKIF